MEVGDGDIQLPPCLGGLSGQNGYGTAPPLPDWTCTVPPRMGGPSMTPSWTGRSAPVRGTPVMNHTRDGMLGPRSWPCIGKGEGKATENGSGGSSENMNIQKYKAVTRGTY